MASRADSALYEAIGDRAAILAQTLDHVEQQRRAKKKKKAKAAAAHVPSVPALPLPPDGFVRLMTLDGQTVMTAELTARPKPANRGGHGPTARPQQVSLLSYNGRDSTVLPLELLLDAWPDGDVEADLRTIDVLTGADGSEPPAFVIEGRGVPCARHEQPSWTWVLVGDPDWGDELPAAAGARAAQAVTLTAQHHLRPSADALTAATTRKYHTVRAGLELKTLTRIGKHYKVSWTRLAALNPSLPADPNHALKAGTRVQLS